ncbi:MAG TPA: methyltransferase domain-containing protein [Pirellulales bacterium]|nr:methyltransferase domain-containing protein [Pirellulales bacterium]
MKPIAYALGTSASAARRLEIQDGQFAAISERLLDALNIRPADRVVELGCGAGSFTRRILRRLGPQGTLLGVDYSQGLLDQASKNLVGEGPARFELVLSDIRDVGTLVAGADVLLERTVLHHLTVPEALLGHLRRVLKPGARLGFIEPEFRALIARLAALESQGRAELAPLRRWAEGISRYYQACSLAPSIGATLGRSLEAAGYDQVRSVWSECATDAAAIENMLLYYNEVREKYVQLGIMTAEEIDRDQRHLASLSTDDLPAVWGMYCVTCQN